MLLDHVYESIKMLQILDQGTLWTESLKFTLFGLTKSLTGFFMSS